MSFQHTQISGFGILFGNTAANGLTVVDCQKTITDHISRTSFHSHEISRNTADIVQHRKIGTILRRFGKRLVIGNTHRLGFIDTDHAVKFGRFGTGINQHKTIGTVIRSGRLNTGVPETASFGINQSRSRCRFLNAYLCPNGIPPSVFIFAPASDLVFNKALRLNTVYPGRRIFNAVSFEFPRLSINGNRPSDSSPPKPIFWS